MTYQIHIDFCIIIHVVLHGMYITHDMRGNTRFLFKVPLFVLVVICLLLG